MKTKALIIAALEGTFRGPRVSLADGERWRIDIEGDVGGTVDIHREDGNVDSLPLVPDMEIDSALAAEIEAVVRRGIASVRALCVG